jgi:hypothetical protein
MSLSPSSVITAAKAIRQDESVTAQTVTDALYLTFFKDGLKALVAKAPRARLQEIGLLAPISDIDAVTTSNWTTELSWLDAQFHTPLVEYVLYGTYSHDSGDSRDRELAQAHLAAFFKFLGVQ